MRGGPQTAAPPPSAETTTAKRAGRSANAAAALSGHVRAGRRERGELDASAATTRRLPCTRDLAADLRFGQQVVELSPGSDPFDPERVLACRRRQTCPEPRRESQQKIRSAGAKIRRARGSPTRLPATKNRRGGPAPGASSECARRDCGVLESSFCGSFSAPSAPAEPWAARGRRCIRPSPARRPRIGCCRGIRDPPGPAKKTGSGRAEDDVARELGKFAGGISAARRRAPRPPGIWRAGRSGRTQRSPPPATGGGGAVPRETGERGAAPTRSRRTRSPPSRGKCRSPGGDPAPDRAAPPAGGGGRVGPDRDLRAAQARTGPERLRRVLPAPVADLTARRQCHRII